MKTSFTNAAVFGCKNESSFMCKVPANLHNTAKNRIKCSLDAEKFCHVIITRREWLDYHCYLPQALQWCMLAGLYKASLDRITCCEKTKQDEAYHLLQQTNQAILASTPPCYCSETLSTLLLEILACLRNLHFVFAMDYWTSRACIWWWSLHYALTPSLRLYDNESNSYV